MFSRGTCAWNSMVRCLEPVCSYLSFVHRKKCFLCVLGFSKTESENRGLSFSMWIHSSCCCDAKQWCSITPLCKQFHYLRWEISYRNYVNIENQEFTPPNWK
jgi:hypothetical protein